MTRILFIAPDYYGFNEVVYNGLTKYSNCEVVNVNSTLPYKYKNFKERVHNFLLKVFNKQNLKIKKKIEYLRNTIHQYDSYDLLIVNRPDTVGDEELALAIRLAKRSVCLFWDSMDKIPSQKKYLTQFDRYFSFDSQDCNHYGFEEVTNFYFAEKHKISDHTWDVALLMTYDNRIHSAIKIFEYFNHNNIKAKAKIFTYKSNPIQEKLPENMEVIHDIIPFRDSYTYYLDSKIILDLAHPNQTGLSFRPFEAMGLEKKLITTNHSIQNFDFFNAANIHIIDNPNFISIPNDFLESPYHPILASIQDKYYLKNWIKAIIS